MMFHVLQHQCFCSKTSALSPFISLRHDNSDDVENYFSVEAGSCASGPASGGTSPRPRGTWQKLQWATQPLDECSGRCVNGHWHQLLWWWGICSSKPPHSSPSHHHNHGTLYAFSHQCLLWQQRIVGAQDTNAGLSLGTFPWSVPQKESEKEALALVC